MKEKINNTSIKLLLIENNINTYVISPTIKAKKAKINKCVFTFFALMIYERAKVVFWSNIGLAFGRFFCNSLYDNNSFFLLRI